MDNLFHPGRAFAFAGPGRRPAVRPKQTVLHLEELEVRSLLSADGLAGWVAHPNAQLQPAAGLGKAPYSPYQVRHAYGFDKLSLDGAGQTIAIVDAFDHPNILHDLQQFDKAFGLPDPGPSTFTFTKVTPQGKPPVNNLWAGEIALDVEWAHAIAYRANILLVEAKSDSNSDLMAAVDYARHYPGVVAISMSWGGPEFTSESALDHYFTTPAGHQGVAFIASTGDEGTRDGPQWPAVSPNVLAVGGTTLTLTPQNAYGSETGWNKGGGGTSRYVVQPSYQRSVHVSGRRTIPDVAYDANPATGFYIYVSVPQSGHTGWFTFGGTSAGAPQWAALFALADQRLAQVGRGSLTNAQAAIYQLPASDFHDIASGSNGFAARTGYDLLTGRGSPRADKVITDLLSLASSFTIAGNGQRTLRSAAVAGSASPATILPGDLAPSFDPSAGADHGENRQATTMPSWQTVTETTFAWPSSGLTFENAHHRSVTQFLAPNTVTRLARPEKARCDLFENVMTAMVDQQQG